MAAFKYALASAALLASLSVAAPASALTIRELASLNRLSEPALSPDGHKLVYTQRVTDLAANKGRTDLWLYDLKSKTSRQLTTHEAGDHAARWSDDGQWLYFLSSRSGTSQIWRLSLAGGEAQQVSSLPLDVTTFKLAPGNGRVALSLDVFPDCQDLACTVKRLETVEKSKASGKVYDGLFVRHWDSFADGRRSHVFSATLDKNGKLGVPQDLMRAMAADTPSKPGGGDEEYNFSHDGKLLYFSTRNAGREEAWSTNFDIYQTPADGSEKPKNLTADNKAWDSQPVVSPDGRYLAWLAMEHPMYEADRFRIRLRDLKLGVTQDLAGDWDRSVASLAFADDSDSLYVTAQDLGQKPLFKIDLDDGKPRKLVKDGTVSGFSVANGRVVYAWDNLKAPADLYVLDGSKSQRLTQANKEALAKASLGDAEQFSFAGAKGDTVYGYVVKPADFSAAKKYPVAFLVHGGPQSSLANAWGYRWNPQVYADAGYVAVMIDFHGSTGYGQAFTDAIRGDWGGKPLEDLQKGLDAAVKKYSFIDDKRVCALGASYGGYMMNWIAGQWKDRFKCLVNHAGIFDLRTMYYSTEEIWFPEWEMMGAHHDKPELYSTWNPARFVNEWKTPMLVLHGQLDYRIPVEQGLATFTALQRRNIPSKFVYFPDENHWINKPHNSIQWHEEVLAWLGKYTKK